MGWDDGPFVAETNAIDATKQGCVQSLGSLNLPGWVIIFTRLGLPNQAPP